MMWNRLLCLLGRHDWHFTRVLSDCPIYWQHQWVGADADCLRCGKQHRDFENHANMWHGGVESLVLVSKLSNAVD